MIEVVNPIRVSYTQNDLQFMAVAVLGVAFSRYYLNTPIHDLQVTIKFILFLKGKHYGNRYCEMV